MLRDRGSVIVTDDLRCLSNVWSVDVLTDEE